MKACLYIFTIFISVSALGAEKKQFFNCDYKNESTKRTGKVLVGPMDSIGTCENEGVVVEKFYCTKTKCSWETHISSRFCSLSEDGKTIRILGNSNHNSPASTMWEATKVEEHTYKGKILVNELGAVEMTCNSYIDKSE